MTRLSATTALVPFLIAAVGPSASSAQNPSRAQDSVIVPDSSLDGVVNCDYNSVAVSPWARAHGAPSFSDFAVAPGDTFVAHRVRPQLVTRTDRLYRTAIRDASGRHRNFAGHFNAFTIGCGTSCAALFIVDERTGRVYDAPPLGWPMFRADSRLMIFDGPYGAPETDSLGRLASYPATYYEWNGDRLVLRDSLNAAGWHLSEGSYHGCTYRQR